MALLAAQKGVDVEAKDCKGSTALYWAASRGQLEMVLFLIKVVKANPSAANMYRSTLHVAAGYVAASIHFSSSLSRVFSY